MPAGKSQPRLNRRQALGLIAVTAGGGTFLPASAVAQGQAGDPALLLPNAGVCTITPETTEGPFYFDPELERSDITDGREGAPLAVRLQVVDQDCRPIPNARVDIWHCDAIGRYSGYPGQGDGNVDTSGEKFLRGWLRGDESGVVAFQTIYPGWYRGRTTHIHFKAFPDDNLVVTGQLFFPDEVSERIFSTVAPYKDRGRKRDTMNADDGILRRAGPSVQATVRSTEQAYEALMIIAVSASG